MVNNRQQISLVSDPRAIDGLKYAGVDVVSLANNHQIF